MCSPKGIWTLSCPGGSSGCVALASPAFGRVGIPLRGKRNRASVGSWRGIRGQDAGFDAATFAVCWGYQGLLAFLGGRVGAGAVGGKRWGRWGEVPRAASWLTATSTNAEVSSSRVRRERRPQPEQQERFPRRPERRPHTEGRPRRQGRSPF